MTDKQSIRRGVVAKSAKLLITIFAAATLLACSQTPKDPNPEPTEAERMSMQNECVKIADRSERQKCLDQAIFGNSF